MATNESTVRQAIEAILWDQEPDYQPEGLDLVDHPDRLLWATSRVRWKVPA